MQLTEQRNEQQLFVRKADATSVVVIDRKLTSSLLLSPNEAVTDFPARTVDQLDAAAIERILALQPELVLLGSGARAMFPAQTVLGEFLRRGIGLETMDNAAAARTFNVLAGEGRKVVAVFLLPG
ncbi:MAG: Mth938-like domain-containing protein [Rudaea sp.]|uniref:Mth938-like domain-containing protein n=1 Tax=Rudaea sp. TaxID=2136325 RepID=UPI0039E56070